MSLLTDEQRTKAYEDLMQQTLRSQDAEAVLQYARAIESATIQAIKDRGALAFHHETEGLDYTDYYVGNVPLYSLEGL